MPHNVIFGPVSSRRLGISLGIDIVPMSLCSFDCIYCELGQTARKTTGRQEYILTPEVDAALEEYFQSEGPAHLDYVTFSGSGEPTLHSNIKHFIAKVKSLTDTPVAILTNSSLLPDPQVRKDIMDADLVVPSLDAATQEVFERINRPAPGIEVRTVIEGIRLFTEEFHGEVWLEVLFVEGVNDHPSEVGALAEAARLIKPTRIQIGTVVRPPSEGDVYPVDPEDLEQIASRFRGGGEGGTEGGVQDIAEGGIEGGAREAEGMPEGGIEGGTRGGVEGRAEGGIEGGAREAEGMPEGGIEGGTRGGAEGRAGGSPKDIRKNRAEDQAVSRSEGASESRPKARSEGRSEGRFQTRVEVIPTFRRIGEREFSRHQAERIVAMLRIRPVTLEELCDTLGMHRREVLKYIDALRRDHKIETKEFEGKTHYTTAGNRGA